MITSLMVLFKFTYRKFSCDKVVVVIDKKPIINCRTAVGILTGINYNYLRIYNTVNIHVDNIMLQDLSRKQFSVNGIQQQTYIVIVQSKGCTC